MCIQSSLYIMLVGEDTILLFGDGHSRESPYYDTTIPTHICIFLLYRHGGFQIVGVDVFPPVLVVQVERN